PRLRHAVRIPLPRPDRALLPRAIARAPRRTRLRPARPVPLGLPGRSTVLNCPQAQTPPLSITGRRFHSTAHLGRPSRYVIIGASNRVITLTYHGAKAPLRCRPCSTKRYGTLSPSKRGRAR